MRGQGDVKRVHLNGTLSFDITPAQHTVSPRQQDGQPIVYRHEVAL